MARALIVGCGCRGRELGGALRDNGWVVRGTSRTEAGAELIAAAGIEAAVADPDRIATVLDAIEGVTLIFWLLGSAAGEPDSIAALHGPRLERLLEEIVDTPVRALVYEVTRRSTPSTRRPRSRPCATRARGGGSRSRSSTRTSAGPSSGSRGCWPRPRS